MNETFNIFKSFSCQGVLIDRNTVLTTSQCIVTQFTETVMEKEYVLPIILNKEYPTYESMITIQLGLSNSVPEQIPISYRERTVKNIIKVFQYFFIFIFEKKSIFTFMNL